MLRPSAQRQRRQGRPAAKITHSLAPETVHCRCRTGSGALPTVRWRTPGSRGAAGARSLDEHAAAGRLAGAVLPGGRRDGYEQVRAWPAPTLDVAQLRVEPAAQPSPGVGEGRRAASGLADGPDRAGAACAQNVSLAGVVPTRAPSTFRGHHLHAHLHAGVLHVRRERRDRALTSCRARPRRRPRRPSQRRRAKKIHALKDYSLPMASREGRSKPSTPSASSAACTTSPPTSAAPSIATAPTSPTSATPSAARGGPS